ncbi:hypothetical protein BN2475_270018 [Paraburkholderia ribeironis]|uniref:Uncharacterized protein n=1 Tax=Paraburkholderia ribeironis TaxID=1247936 RepID=A0A1N7RZR1_9BURK|nr:hypothetical protein BN2475_270018 [Paraburkholderia ribeironis]
MIPIEAWELMLLPVEDAGCWPAVARRVAPDFLFLRDTLASICRYGGEQEGCHRLSESSKYHHGASFLAVHSVWQFEGKVMHLVAKHLVDRSNMLGSLRFESHDFH